MAFSFRLDNLELTNYRKFKHFTVDFDPRLTVLVGENGSGKSTVLAAACVALGAFTTPLVMREGPSLTKTDAHVCRYDLDGTIDQQPQYPVSVAADAQVGEGVGRSVTWSRGIDLSDAQMTRFKSDELGVMASECSARIKAGDSSLVLPVIAHYGTGRMWDSASNRINRSPQSFTRQDGYRGSLDAVLDTEQLLAWFYKMTAQDVQRSQSLKPMGPNPLFAAVRKAVEQCFQAITQADKALVSYNLDVNDLDVEYFDKKGEYHRLPLSQFSDGYRTMMSMVADIAYRMALLNPMLGEEVLETPGVVLIDEVDLHLHPLWQARVLQDLQAIFPYVQFIVTTHAPMVISSVPGSCIRILGDERAYKPEQKSFGLGSNDVLTGIMGAQDRQPEVQELLDRFSSALDQGSYDEVDQVLDELEAKTGPSNPDLVAARSALAFERL